MMVHKQKLAFLHKRDLSVSGFTLIELLLVMAGIIAVSAFLFPVSISFLQKQRLDETAGMIESTLRRAEAQALFQKHDSPFGVKFFAGSYVLFRGASYAARESDFDESFDVPAGASISGISEVVFEKRTGAPNATGTVTIANEYGQQTVTIYGQGTIE